MQARTLYKYTCTGVHTIQQLGSCYMVRRFSHENRKMRGILGGFEVQKEGSRDILSMVFNEVGPVVLRRRIKMWGVCDDSCGKQRFALKSQRHCDMHFCIALRCSRESSHMPRILRRWRGTARDSGYLGNDMTHFEACRGRVGQTPRILYGGSFSCPGPAGTF